MIFISLILCLISKYSAMLWSQTVTLGPGQRWCCARAMSHVHYYCVIVPEEAGEDIPVAWIILEMENEEKCRGKSRPFDRLPSQCITSSRV